MSTYEFLVNEYKIEVQAASKNEAYLEVIKDLPDNSPNVIVFVGSYASALETDRLREGEEYAPALVTSLLEVVTRHLSSHSAYMEREVVAEKATIDILEVVEKWLADTVESKISSNNHTPPSRLVS